MSRSLEISCSININIPHFFYILFQMIVWHYFICYLSFASLYLDSDCEIFRYTEGELQWKLSWSLVNTPKMIALTFHSQKQKSVTVPYKVSVQGVTWLIDCCMHWEELLPRPTHSGPHPGISYCFALHKSSLYLASVTFTLFHTAGSVCERKTTLNLILHNFKSQPRFI